MIDIKKAKQELKKYVNNYDIENNRIRVKIGHIERTATIAKEIAQNLELSEEDIQLAELIGLLHDIGRFEQVRRYNTFIDEKSINHGELGVQILFEQGYIRNFLKDRKYDEIIRKSILNHNRNKEKIETSSDKEKLHTKIIRDADKIDIIYLLTFENKETAWGSNNMEEEKASDHIYQEFIENQSVNYQKRKTAVDNLISHFAYVYDFSYDCALQVIREKDYFKKIYQRFNFKDKETKNKIYEIYKIVEQYLENK